jgi:hypothetical protein
VATQAVFIKPICATFLQRLALRLLNNFSKSHKVMNASNPFQIPTCFQNNLEQRRRERFKKTIIAIVAGVVALLAALLIQGCQSEHARLASAMTLSGDASAAFSVTGPGPVSEQITSAPSPKVMPSTATIVSKSGAPLKVVRAETIYIVKSSDTLGRIAKAHGTTIQAIKSVNGLATDAIAIGMKLKLPEA